jgi:hypothetical protein
MSSSTLIEGPGASGANGAARVLGAWEERGQVHCGSLDVESNARWSAAPLTSADSRKHPALARDSRGEILLAWSEGSGWQRGGKLRWQRFDASGKAIAGASGGGPEIPTWSFAAAYATADGRSFVMY